VGASSDARKDFITPDSYLPKPWASAEEEVVADAAMPRAAAITWCNADDGAVPRGFVVITAQCEHRLKISFNSLSTLTSTCLSWPKNP
jgi:hypothetical protein